MVTALVQLRQSLGDADAALRPRRGRRAPHCRATEMIDQLEDYVIPRLMTLEAPLLAVVGGSTGAGKSTLVNSLVGHRVTTPGVLRPTTRSPVLVHHPDDAEWFGQDRLLPDLKRVEHATDDPDSIQLVATDAIPAGLAILDAPDVDSVEERNRILAAQLLAAGDLWLFVTSAARYADQVPWELPQAGRRPLDVGRHRARPHPRRGHPDRLRPTWHGCWPAGASRTHRSSPSPRARSTTTACCPAHHVSDIRQWLESLAEDTDARDRDRAPDPRRSRARGHPSHLSRGRRRRRAAPRRRPPGRARSTRPTTAPSRP